MASSFLDKTGLTYLWSKIKEYISGVLPGASATTPIMDGTATVGTSTTYARADHVHPSDTTKVDKVAGKGLSENDFTTALKNKLDGIATGANVTELSTNISTDSTSDTKAATPKAVATYVATQVSSLWSPGGSVTFANLPAANATNVNKIYNIKDDFTTTASFVEGAGKSYPAGTNVVVVNLSGSYQYDALSGIVDLSGYLTTSDVISITNAEIDTITA